MLPPPTRHQAAVLPVRGRTNPRPTRLVKRASLHDMVPQDNAEEAAGRYAVLGRPNIF